MSILNFVNSFPVFLFCFVWEHLAASFMCSNSLMDWIADSYLSSGAPVAGVPKKDSRKSPGRSGNGFLEDATCSDNDISMREPSGSALKLDHSNNVDTLSSIMSLIREHVGDYVAIAIIFVHNNLDALYLFWNFVSFIEC